MRFLLDHSVGGTPIARLLRECCRQKYFPELEVFSVHDVYEPGLRHASDDEPWFAWCGRQQPRVCLISKDYRSYLSKDPVRQAMQVSGIHIFVMGKKWGNASFHNILGRLLVLWDSIWEHAADEKPFLHELTYGAPKVVKVCPTGQVAKGQKLRHE